MLAWILVRSDLPGRRAAFWIIGLMIFLPLYLQASAWQAGFGQEGWYSRGETGRPWLSGWYAALWVQALAAIPWIVLIVGLGMRTVEPAFGRQALLDGTPWQAFWRVTMPACRSMGLAATWVAMLIAGDMTVTSIFFVRTYSEEVFNQIALHDENWDAANALAPGIVGTMVLLALAIYFCFRAAARPTIEHAAEPDSDVGELALAADAWLGGGLDRTGRGAGEQSALQGRRIGGANGNRASRDVGPSSVCG